MRGRYIHNPSFIAWTVNNPLSVVNINSNYNPSSSSPALNRPFPLLISVTKNSTNTPASASYSISLTVPNTNDNRYIDGIVTINYTTPYSYNVSGGLNGQYSAYVDVSPLNSSSTLYGSPFLISVVFNNTSSASRFIRGDYVVGDTYILNVDVTTLDSKVGVYTELLRPIGSIIGDQSSASLLENGIILPLLTSLNLSNNFNRSNRFTGYITNNSSNCNVTNMEDVIVPIIDILGQTTVDGEFLSDFKFIIQDKYCYKSKNIVKEKCCHNDKGCNCKTLYCPENKLKTTTFYQDKIPLQDVVKGKGKTLKCKLLHYYNKHYQTIGPSFENFYDQMILYGMLKYILAKLIYGDFNISYLYKNFNEQFFKDLSNTRFCGFIQFFDNPDNYIIDYDHYFICGDVQKC
jgi:hypothetical protein